MTSRWIFRHLLVLGVLIWGQLLSAQKVALTHIEFLGLKKTKQYILERELTFRTGDSLDLSQVMDFFEDNEKKLLNTGLLTFANLNLINLDMGQFEAGVRITVKEALYLYPVPLVEILDNDFNKWWNVYGRSLKLISYGLFVRHTNLTGNNDNLTAYAQAGFTRKVSVNYFMPYINRRNTFGVGIQGFHSRNRVIAYTTLNNQQVLKLDLKKDQLIRSKAGVYFLHRPRLYFRQMLIANHHWYRMSDSLFTYYNPDFFNGRQNIDFIELEYQAAYDTRDVRSYPMRGHLVSGWVNKISLMKEDVINQLHVGVDLRYYSTIRKKWTMEHIVTGRYNLDRAKVPYYFNRALGSKDLNLRGYENYLIDGQDFAMVKNSLRWKFLDHKLDLGEVIPQSYRLFIVNMLLTANIDVGYVNDRFYGVDNLFSNRTLVGYGMGLDMVFYHNKLLRLEVSRNHTGEIGLYLHFDAGL